MKTLRVRCFLTAMLVLGAAPLIAQSSRISCRDGTRPKIGHFSCWGHGGLVREEMKVVARPVVAKKEKADKSAKPAKATKATKSGKATKSVKPAKATTPTKTKPREKLIAAQHTAK